MKALWRKNRPKIIGTLAHYVVRMIGATLSIRTEGFEKVKALEGGVIICGWHGKSLVPGYFLRRRGVWVIISQSRDGELQNQVFSRLGFNVIRGSTGRGGARAAVEAIRVLRSGAWMAITPDGPRGPSGVVQPGVVLMAQKSGACLVPVGVGARPAWRVRSWDRYLVPLPFAKALFAFGEPMRVSESAGPDELESVRLRLEQAIHQMDTHAERDA